MTTIRDQIWVLHKRGLNTLEIANILKMKESQIYRNLLDVFDAIHLERERHEPTPPGPDTMPKA